MTALEVLATGALTTVQDLGRPRMARLGVPQSGAFDRGALRRGNRLVGNLVDAAGLECVLGGLALRATRHVTVAVTGADVPVDVDGRPADRGTPLALRPGATLRLGTARQGLRAYVAVRGGIAVREELGSRSFDALSGLGPAPVAVGDALPTGDAALWDPVVDHSPEPPLPVEPTLRVRLGPRADHLTDAGLAGLLNATWTVSADSDRVGIRLEGPVLAHAGDAGVLPSEPTVRGAVQVPPDGRPVVFGPDHPTTGGYPVVAVVVHADLDLLAQLRPGDRCRLQATERR